MKKLLGTIIALGLVGAAQARPPLKKSSFKQPVERIIASGVRIYNKTGKNITVAKKKSRYRNNWQQQVVDRYLDSRGEAIIHDINGKKLTGMKVIILRSSSRHNFPATSTVSNGKSTTAPRYNIIPELGNRSSENYYYTVSQGGKTITLNFPKGSNVAYLYNGLEVKYSSMLTYPAPKIITPKKK